MDLQKSLKQAWDILLLKEPAMNQVAKDPDALQPAYIIVALTSVVTALGNMLFPTVVGRVVYRYEWLDMVLDAGLSIAFGIGLLYLTGYLAESVFHSKLSMQGYVKVMGHATLVNIVALFPPVSFIAGVWALVVMCFTLNKLGKMQAGSIILLILLQGLVFAAIGYAMLGAGLASMPLL